MATFAIVVDDDDDSRSDIMSLFPTKHFGPCEGYSSKREFDEKFLDTLSTRGFKDVPGIFFIDIRMERNDSGIQLLRTIRRKKKLRRVPVVIISGSDDDKDIADALFYGANLYLLKSDDPGDFTTAIKQVIETVSVAKTQYDISDYLEQHPN